MANESKPFNPKSPFSRINYPNFLEQGPSAEPHLSGKGFACGCNNSSDFPLGGLGGIAAIGITRLRDIMRAIPGWVPAMTDIARPDEEREIQGRLVRSFQTWTDVPLRQWHCFYDWNFHVDPEPGFDFCRGQANISSAKVDDKSVTEIQDGAVVSATRQFEPVIKGNTMECEWDTGTFGRRPGAMFRRHWNWPMTGEIIWCVGRPIYDCGHPGDNPKDPVTFNRTRTEIHPVKGMAAAKFEAHNFSENGGRFTPAVKFTFFACRKGGYFEFDKLNDRDYEFIVDLPPLEPPRGPFPIGHTPNFPINTIELMPRLLHHFDFTPFQEALSETPDAKEEPLPRFGEVVPIITPVDDFDFSRPQVKVKIPLTSLSADKEACGVSISLGWFDPDGLTAPRVKKVTVTFQSVETASAVHTKGDMNFSQTFVGDPEATLLEHWFLKLAVNGRWFFFDSGDNSIGVRQRIPLANMTHTMFLQTDELIRLSAHGAEINSVDAMMRRDREQRFVTFQPFPGIDGERVQYARDVQNGGVPGPPTGDPDQKKSRLPRQQRIFREFIFKMIPLTEESNPLGIIDQTIPVSSLVEGDTLMDLRALYTSEIGTSAELAETKAVVDYTIRAKVTVASQI